MRATQYTGSTNTNNGRSPRNGLNAPLRHDVPPASHMQHLTRSLTTARPTYEVRKIMAVPLVRGDLLDLERENRVDKWVGRQWSRWHAEKAHKRVVQRVGLGWEQ